MGATTVATAAMVATDMVATVEVMATMARGPLMPSPRLMLLLSPDTATTAATAVVTMAAMAMVATVEVMATTARGPLMPSPAMATMAVATAMVDTVAVMAVTATDVTATTDKSRANSAMSTAREFCTVPGR